MKGWVLVTRCPDATMAPLIQGGLEAEGIPCVVMNKQDSRLCTLEQALLSVGYPASGLLPDSYEVGTDISNWNTAFFAARVYMAVWRA